MASTVVDLRWLCYLLYELGISLKSPPILCDNTYALQIAHNPIFHACTRHIEVDYHFIHELLARGSIQACHVSFDLQATDIFTKALAANQFKRLQTKLSLQDNSFSLRGRVKMLHEAT